MYKVDLHTHSVVSPDGGITVDHYKRILQKGILDCIAITDHNTITFAKALHDELGDHVIVGEEIMTKEGEIIGLFLENEVPPYMTPLDTVKFIKDQGGLVYIPHPFETVRKGLHPAVTDELLDYIDIFEVCNGRAFLQNRSAQAVLYARLNKIISVASSDAHGMAGLGATYTRLSALPDSAESLLQLLKNGTPITERPKLRALLYPKYYRLRKKLEHQ